LDDCKQEEKLYTQRSKIRLDHLSELSDVTSIESEAYARWSKTRLDRVLVDYMLRNGYNESAAQIAKGNGIEVST